MDQISIFEPMIALAGLTFLALLNVPIRRFASAFRGQTTRNDYKFGESDKVPGYVAIANRNLMNLLEMPVLFYVVSLSLYTTGLVSPLQVWFAWAYVALRAAHSVVHLTFNHVLVRLTVFAISNVMLALMWVNFVRDLAAARGGL